MRLCRVIGLLSVILTCEIAFGANVKTDYDRSFDFARICVGRLRYPY
ncbi:MAG TPA: hypothetical protein VIX17_03775 [Pyrinomonadaceae bacterium]|jgi:hypothetical protein